MYFHSFVTNTERGVYKPFHNINTFNGKDIHVAFIYQLCQKHKIMFHTILFTKGCKNYIEIQTKKITMNESKLYNHLMKKEQNIFIDQRMLKKSFFLIWASHHTQLKIYGIL